MVKQCEAVIIDKEVAQVFTPWGISWAGELLPSISFQVWWSWKKCIKVLVSWGKWPRCLDCEMQVTSVAWCPCSSGFQDQYPLTASVLTLTKSIIHWLLIIIPALRTVLFKKRDKTIVQFGRKLTNLSTLMYGRYWMHSVGIKTHDWTYMYPQ